MQQPDPIEVLIDAQVVLRESIDRRKREIRLQLDGLAIDQARLTKVRAQVELLEMAVSA